MCERQDVLQTGSLFAAVYLCLASASIYTWLANGIDAGQDECLQLLRGSSLEASDRLPHAAARAAHAGAVEDV